MLPDWLPWLLQVNDSQFPSGSYAHSLGLEGMVQLESVRTAADLEAFLRRQIAPSLQAFELPYLRRAHAAAAAENVDALRALDDELEAWKLAAELRAASRQIGSRRLALVRKLCPASVLEQYAVSGAPCHHLIITALELRSAPVEAAVCAFVYQTLSGYTSASLKLLRIGQEKAHTILRTVAAELLDLHFRQAPEPDARTGWFNPLLEIASLRHARAAERLFIS